MKKNEKYLEINKTSHISHGDVAGFVCMLYLPCSTHSCNQRNGKRSRLYHGRINPVVHIAAHTEDNDAEGANGQRQLGVDMTAEGGQWVVVMLDVHGLDNEQIVVKADNGVDQSDEHDGINGCADG